MTTWKASPLLSALYNGVPCVTITDRFGKLLYQKTGGVPADINATVAMITKLARAGAAK